MPQSVAADSSCFGCRMLRTKLSGEVLGFLLRTFPNIEAVSLNLLTLCHNVDFLCCLVSLSIFRMVSSETVRLALNASTVIRKAAALGGVGFEGAVVLLSQ